MSLPIDQAIGNLPDGALDAAVDYIEAMLECRARAAQLPGPNADHASNKSARRRANFQYAQARLEAAREALIHSTEACASESVIYPTMSHFLSKLDWEQAVEGMQEEQS